MWRFDSSISSPLLFIIGIMVGLFVYGEIRDAVLRRSRRKRTPVIHSL